MHVHRGSDHTRSPRALLPVVAVLLVLDVLACAGSMGAALWMRFGGDVPSMHAEPYIRLLPLLILTRLAVAYAARLYDFRMRLLPSDHLYGAVVSAVTGVALGYVVRASVQLYYEPDFELSRLVAVIDGVLLFAWFAVSRAIALAVLQRVGYAIRVGLIGSPETCDELAAEIARHAPPLLHVSRIITLEDNGASADAALNALQGLDADGNGGVDQLIVAPAVLPPVVVNALLRPRETGAPECFLHPELDLPLMAGTRVLSISGLPLIPLSPAYERSPYRWIKRTLDATAALASLILLAPAFAVVALAVKVTSQGPVFYRQQRVGWRGRPFSMVKFRTMIDDAEKASGPVLSVANDPRITPLGRTLRKTRVDEWPQLWNVLLGDMSFVGPRPEREAFHTTYAAETPLYERRVAVRPGLTGLAQVHGRYDTAYKHKLRYDLIYINSLSFATDVRILAATLPIVLTGKGAQ